MEVYLYLKTPFKLDLCLELNKRYEIEEDCDSYFIYKTFLTIMPINEKFTLDEEMKEIEQCKRETGAYDYYLWMQNDDYD
jgi:hypothetical protein